MWCVTMVITALKGSYNSVVECCCHIAEVPGSNPGGSTENMKKNFLTMFLTMRLMCCMVYGTTTKYGSLAQMDRST